MASRAYAVGIFVITIFTGGTGGVSSTSIAVCDASRAFVAIIEITCVTDVTFGAGITSCTGVTGGAGITSCAGYTTTAISAKIAVCEARLA